MSSKKAPIIKNIRDLAELLDSDNLVRGSIATVYTKCGKDNCRCKEEKGHPHARISWSEKGQGYTRKVPKNEIEWCLEKTENYRRFRSLKSKLKDLEGNTANLLNALEDVLVDDTRKDISFLWIKK
jgi:hypothetical protein